MLHARARELAEECDFRFSTMECMRCSLSNRQSFEIMVSIWTIIFVSFRHTPRSSPIPLIFEGDWKKDTWDNPLGNPNDTVLNVDNQLPSYSYCSRSCSREIELNSRSCTILS
jgi:hypothetical protein